MSHIFMGIASITTFTWNYRFSELVNNPMFAAAVPIKRRETLKEKLWTNLIGVERNAVLPTESLWFPALAPREKKNIHSPSSSTSHIPWMPF